MVSWGGSAAYSGRRVALARGVKERDPRMGRTRLASSSRGRWDLLLRVGDWFSRRVISHWEKGGCSELCGSLGPCA